MSKTSKSCARRGGLVVSALDSELSPGRGLSAGQDTVSLS